MIKPTMTPSASPQLLLQHFHLHLQRSHTMQRLVCHKSTELGTNYDTELHLTSAAAAAAASSPPSPAQSPDTAIRLPQIH
jgi:hypothetical protein